MSLFKFGKFNEAIEMYDKTIEVDPKYLDAYINKGVCLNQLKKCDEALKEYDKAIKINKNYPMAYYNKGLTFFEMKSLLGCPQTVPAHCRARCPVAPPLRPAL